MNHSTEHELLLSNAFSGHTQHLLLNRYGDPREKGWARKWLHVWRIKDDFPWFPSSKLYVHKHFYLKLYAAFKQLEEGDLQLKIKTLDEDFNIRYIQGSTYVLSAHSWGAAIDMNIDRNYSGEGALWSTAFINIMQKNDIYCVQDRTDSMTYMQLRMLN